MNIYLDFDGTVVDIKQRHHIVYVDCVVHFGGSPLGIDEYWQLKREDAKWKEILPLSGLNPSIERSFLAEFIHRIESPEMLRVDVLFKDAIESLEQLARQNRLVLVSLRRNHGHLMEQLKYLGITKYFENVLSGHSETKEGVLHKKSEVITAAGYRGGGCIIGDTEADVSAGKMLSLTTIAITTGIRSHEFLSKLGPDNIVDSLKECRELIE